MKVTQYRVPQGPEHDLGLGHGYGVNHVVSRTVRDSAAMLDATDMPEVDSPIPRRRKPGLTFSRSQRRRANCASPSPKKTPNGRPIHPEVRAALQETAKLLESLGHHVEERSLGINYPQALRRKSRRARCQLRQFHARARQGDGARAPSSTSLSR